MYKKICQFDSLLAAYHRAQACKRFDARVLQFGFQLESQLLRLQRELVSEQYQPSAYTYFTVHDPKTRAIAAPAFRDRVVQHALVAEIEPIFDKKFIFDSYACRKNKGTHLGLARVKKFLQAARSVYGSEVPTYCLRLDVSKYFANISWDVLLPIIFASIPCPQTQGLIWKIVTLHRGKTLGGVVSNQRAGKGGGVVDDGDPVRLNPKNRIGLPIGNLTSQLFANIYLDQLDQFVKHQLRIRWYARYMDDVLIIHLDKERLKVISEQIRDFLSEELRLTLAENKVVISQVKDGVPFVGYRVFYDHVLIRANTLTHIKRKLCCKRRLMESGELSEEKWLSSLASVRGHLSHASSFSLMRGLGPSQL